MIHSEPVQESFFISPFSGAPLSFDPESKRLFNGQEEFQSRDEVFILLKGKNEEYEGAYLNKVKFIPPIDVFPFTIPLWMMTSGYVWEVRQQFKKGAVICELGCASGVNYFGNQFKMIGLDFSFESLKHIENYQYKIQANAISLPFKSESMDGIISSFFWEHISPEDKLIMLHEFKRVLKPGGKVVMLYDVETQNELIKKLKVDNPKLYEELFLHGDHHIGYETLEANEQKYTSAGFAVIKHLGLERTAWQGNSVYTKLSKVPASYGRMIGIMKRLTSNKWFAYLNMFGLRVIDVTIGRLYNKSKSRIAISVLQK